MVDFRGVEPQRVAQERIAKLQVERNLSDWQRADRKHTAWRLELLRDLYGDSQNLAWFSSVSGARLSAMQRTAGAGQASPRKGQTEMVDLSAVKNAKLSKAEPITNTPGRVAVDLEPVLPWLRESYEKGETMAVSFKGSYTPRNGQTAEEWDGDAADVRYMLIKGAEKLGYGVSIRGRQKGNGQVEIRFLAKNRQKRTRRATTNAPDSAPEAATETPTA